MAQQMAQQLVEQLPGDCCDCSQVTQVLQQAGCTADVQAVQQLLCKPDPQQKVSKGEVQLVLEKLPISTFKMWVMRKVFRDLDKDRSGSLSQQEIQACFCGKGQCAQTGIPQDVVNTLLCYVSKDSDHQVSYEEFLYCYCIDSLGPIMQEVFRGLDKDKNGSLTRDEILAATQSDHRIQLAKGLISDLLTAWVMDKDNKVNYSEFIKAWLGQKEKPKIPTF